MWPPTLGPGLLSSMISIKAFRLKFLGHNGGPEESNPRGGVKEWFSLGLLAHILRWLDPQNPPLAHRTSGGGPGALGFYQSKYKSWIIRGL